MAAQQHKIMRQVLEARECPPADEHRVRSELRSVYYERLLPLIDKICSDSSTPGRVHRIETLEIDLGHVPLDGLEPVLAARFEEAFSRDLAAAIGDAPEIDAELELFSHFVATGTVPWWADLSDHALLEASLDGLIGRDPHALRRAMQEAGDTERTLRRIARAFSDRVLDDLAGVLAPTLSSCPPGRCAAWGRALESASGTWGFPAGAARRLWWEEVLRAATADGDPATRAPRFFHTVLARVARRLGIDIRVLLAELHRSLDEAVLPLQVWVRESAGDLWRELTGDATETRGSASPGEFIQASESPRADGVRVGTPREGLWADLRAAIDRLPAHVQAHALAGVAALEAGDGRAGGGRAAWSGAMVSALAALQETLIPSELGAELRDVLRGRAIPERIQDPSADSRFSDADEVYVENAGLVILWPFLANFFRHVGLVEEKAFRDSAAAHRAAGLLQYLATGEAAASEHLLPLNKLLCGIPPEEVFDFGVPITDTEIEACTDMLGAVIHQAPILRDMSIAGFRASFLLRKGQLSARDGNWLLRVERETHDIVLDRFPWSVRVVKLPWMAALMQVEW